MSASAPINVSDLHGGPSNQLESPAILHAKLLQLSGMLLPALMQINVASRQLAVDSCSKDDVAAGFTRVLEVLGTSGAFAGEIGGMLTPKATGAQKSLENSFQKQIEAKDAEIAQLKASLADMEKKCGKQNRQLERLQKKLEEAQSFSSGLESSMKLLHDARDYWKRKFNGLQSSVSAEKQALRESRLAEEKEREKANAEKVAQAEGQNSVQKAPEKDAASQVELRKALEDLAQARAQIANLRNQLDVQIVLCQGFQHKNELLRVESASAQADKLRLQELGKLEEQAQRQNEQLAAQNEVLGRQNQKIAQLTAELEAALQQKAENAQKQADEAQKLPQESQKQVKDGQAQTDELQARDDAAAGALEAARKQISELLEKAQAAQLAQQELNEAREQIIFLQNSVTMNEQIVSDLNEQLAEREGTISTLKKDNAALCQSIDDQTSKIERLNGELAAQREAINQHNEAQNRQIQQRADDFAIQSNAANQQLQAELARAKDQNARLQEQANNYFQMYQQLLQDHVQTPEKDQVQTDQPAADVEQIQQIVAMNEDLTQKQQQIDSQADQIAKQAELIQDQSTEIGQKDLTIDQLNQRIGELHACLNQLIDSQPNRQETDPQELQRAQDQVKAKTDEVAQLNQQLANQRAANATQKQQIGDLVANAEASSKTNAKIAVRIVEFQRQFVQSIQKAKTELQGVTALSSQFDKLAVDFVALLKQRQAQKQAKESEPDSKWELKPGNLLEQIEALQKYYNRCDHKETLPALIVPESHRWYCEKFSPVQMEIYEDMIKGYTNFEQFVEVSPSLNTTLEDASVIHSAALHDYPELFYIGNSIGSTSVENGPMIKIKLFENPIEGKSRAELVGLQLKVLKQAAKLAEKAKSEKQELHIFFQNYLHEGVQYNTDLGTTPQGFSHTYRASGCLFHGKCVCQGISLGWQLLANFGHVWSISISGDAGEKKEKIERHAWNMIQLDGQYCICDFTWNLTTKTFKYMCCNSGFIINSHTPDEKFKYPHCDSMDHFYYKQQGQFIDVSLIQKDQINEALKTLMKKQIIERKNKTMAEITIFALSLNILGCKDAILQFGKDSCDELNIACTSWKGLFTEDIINLTLTLKE